MTPARKRLALASLALLLLGAGAGLLMWHLQSVRSKENVALRTNEVERYNALLQSASINPVISPWEDFDPGDIQLVYEEHRAHSSEVWSALADETRFADIASNALFTVGLVHYLNAGDFGDKKEAGLAVGAFTQALLTDNGSPALGLTTDDINKRKMLELALVLRQKITEEEEKKEQQQQQQQPGLIPGGKDGDKQGTQGKLDGDEPGLEDLPVLGTGVKP